jgi:ferredoxin--NADP+ reductase
VHRILVKEQLAPGIVRFWIDAPRIAWKRRAGQFVIVRVHEGGERIPLTIADADPTGGSIALVVQEAGKTTRDLNKLSAGESILDIAGPLGRPTRIDPGRHVCCVAGGVGAAVVLPIAGAVHDAGGRVTVIAGARTRQLVILERELRAIADECRVLTDDGSYGSRGVVTDALEDVLAGRGPRVERVVAAGPVAMMRAVCDATRPLGVPTDVSLNPIMIDGTGMCGGCRVSVGGRVKFACVDGPEFNGHEVNFDELEARLTAFCTLEQVAAGLAAVPEA